MRERESEYLRFVYNFEANFTNNMAEQSLRGNVLHEKISMAFRSEAASKAEMTCMTYIGTCLKQNKDIHAALKAAFDGKSAEFLFPDGIPEMPEEAKTHKAELEAAALERQQKRERQTEELKNCEEELKATKEKIAELEREADSLKDVPKDKAERAKKLRKKARKMSDKQEGEKGELLNEATRLDEEAGMAKDRIKAVKAEMKQLDEKRKELKKRVKELKRELGIKDEKPEKKAAESGEATAEEQSKQDRKDRKQDVHDHVRQGVDIMKRAKVLAASQRDAAPEDDAEQCMPVPA